MTKSIKLLLLAITILLCDYAKGQDESPAKSAVEFGLQHSINFTHMLGDGGPIVYSNRVENYELIQSRVTFDLGMFATIHVSDKFAIQPEAVYTYMGGHFQKRTTYLHDLGAFEGTENESFAVDYLKAALSANIKFNDRIFFQLGGYGSSLLSAEKFYPWWETDVGNDQTRISLSGIRKFDAGVMGGFGMSTHILNLTFRYNYGLLDVFESGEFEALDLSNGVFQFVLQWKLYSDLR